jgi:hypothetical protein
LRRSYFPLNGLRIQGYCRTQGSSPEKCPAVQWLYKISLNSSVLCQIDLAGQVALEDHAARFSDLSFGVPGAVSRLHGTYNLISHKIDLRGQLKVNTKISNTTSGAKAILLKMMGPFFKKKRKGEVLPVRISGTYEHPSFGLDLYDGDAQKKLPPTHDPMATGRKPDY